MLRWKVEMSVLRKTIRQIILESYAPEYEGPVYGRPNKKDKEGDSLWHQFQDWLNGDDRADGKLAVSSKYKSRSPSLKKVIDALNSARHDTDKEDLINFLNDINTQYVRGKGKVLFEGLGQPELDSASRIAGVAHQNQFRRDGQPYIMHPTAVQAITKRYYPDNIEAQILAMLHDVMEDGPAQSGLTRRQLYRMVKDAIPDDTTAQQSIMNALRVMTHSKRTHPVYEDYLQLVFSNPLAAIVKISDLIHNLSHNPSERQIRKYRNALKRVAIPLHIAPGHRKKLEDILQ